jgi:hypothetical protein
MNFEMIFHSYTIYWAVQSRAIVCRVQEIFAGTAMHAFLHIDSDSTELRTFLYFGFILSVIGRNLLMYCNLMSSV